MALYTASLNRQGEFPSIITFARNIEDDPICRRHVDVRYLPSLVPLPHVNATARAIETDLHTRIARLQAMIDAGTVEIDAPYAGTLFLPLHLTTHRS